MKKLLLIGVLFISACTMKQQNSCLSMCKQVMNQCVTDGVANCDYVTATCMVSVCGQDRTNYSWWYGY